MITEKFIKNTIIGLTAMKCNMIPTGSKINKKFTLLENRAPCKNCRNVFCCAGGRNLENCPRHIDHQRVFGFGPTLSRSTSGFGPPRPSLGSTGLVSSLTVSSTWFCTISLPEAVDSLEWRAGRSSRRLKRRLILFMSSGFFDTWLSGLWSSWISSS